MSRIPVFSVVGYSGTGKTTFLEGLIPILKAKGLRIAVIKHDAHEFEVDREGKDSWRLTRAGADVTALISDKKAVLMENRPIPIQGLIDQIQDVDLIFTEGYKHGDWPKILLHAKRTGKPLPIDPDTCIALCTDDAIETRVPRYSLKDTQAIAELIYGRLPAKEPASWLKSLPSGRSEYCAD